MLCESVRQMARLHPLVREDNHPAPLAGRYPQHPQILEHRCDSMAFLGDPPEELPNTFT